MLILIILGLMLPPSMGEISQVSPGATPSQVAGKPGVPGRRVGGGSRHQATPPIPPAAIG